VQNAPSDRVSQIKWWSSAGNYRDLLVEYCQRGDLEDPNCSLDDDDRPHWILIDDAQRSYSDSEFWNSFLKDLPVHIRAVLFATYGNQQSADVIDNPRPHLVMGRRPSSNGLTHQPNIPGLYFERFEFDELVAKRNDSDSDFPEMDPKLADWVFYSSSGHIGAIDSILTSVESVAKKKYMRSLTLKHFLRHFSDVNQALVECSRGIDSGVPDAEALRHPSNVSAVDFLKKLLAAGGAMTLCLTLAPDDVIDAAWLAHQQGWVTLDYVDADMSSVFVELPSPLHRARLSHHLQCTFGSFAVDAAVGWGRARCAGLPDFDSESPPS